MKSFLLFILVLSFVAFSSESTTNDNEKAYFGWLTVCASDVVYSDCEIKFHIITKNSYGENIVLKPTDSSNKQLTYIYETLQQYNHKMSSDGWIAGYIVEENGKRIIYATRFDVNALTKNCYQ